ncbi:MAG: proline--tRNA ligase [Phycisphaera sp.]|nr:proline--tRNA ligase [Phycisphaera sp.]
MPTLWSQSLIPTLREVPAEAEVPSHQLMLRAGLIRKLGAGMYSYLPLGLRSLQKAMAIIREEMASAGAVEVLMPALVPLELYKQTGRDEAYGDNLFRVKDRHGREQALGPTHEEVITEMIGATCGSYRDLPKTLYQIQTKFRDEFRPRFGVLRSREFQMKDAYSFHTAVDGEGGLNETYQKQYDAYCRIFSRCGLPYVTVEAESGPIGGSASHEFMVPSPTGEDTILESDKGNYAANVEKCEIGPRKFSEIFTNAHTLQGVGTHAQESIGVLPAAPPTGELEQVHTPGCPGIEDVITFFKKNLGTKLKPQNMLKTLVFEASLKSPEEVKKEHEFEAAHTPDERQFVNERFFVLAVVRGDHDVNEGKLKQAVRAINPDIQTVALMEPHDALRHDFIIGFVGPHAAINEPLTQLIIDPDAAVEQFWVAGANEKDHHVKHFNWKRDLLDKLTNHDVKGNDDRVLVTDIRNTVDGDPSPKNDGGVLHTRKGIEVGHVFKLGDKYSKAMNITTLLPDNSRMHPIMGCYGIGVNRILAAAIESDKGHDENGIVWSPAIAPYRVLITPIKFDGRAKDLALKLASELEARGGNPGPIDVLIDDRDERPGVKFKDADLIGIPVRITLGDKALAEDKVEIKARNGSNGPKGELVPITDAVNRVMELLH